jgi:heat shock protein 90kDa beta
LSYSSKHSSFSTAFPIYLWTEKTVEVPDDEVEEAASELKESITPEAIQKPVETPSADEEEAAIIEEEATSPAEDATEETKPQAMKSVQVAEWVQANPQPPLWQRDPKDVTEEEYISFYKATFKDYTDPLAWYHFAGDSGTGTSFRAIIYVPSRLSVKSHRNFYNHSNIVQRP